MKTYLVTYSSSENNNYLLVEKIKTYGYWARPFDWVWLIKTNYSRKNIMDEMRTVTGDSSSILIIEVTNDWIAYSLDTEVVKWMQGNI